MSTSPELPDEVMAALRRGHKIEAIRLLRESYGIGLKQAKELVESVARGPARGARKPDVTDNPPLIEPGPNGPRIGRALFLVIALAGGFLLLRGLVD